MATYRITPHNGFSTLCTVRANSYERAADIAARKLHGRNVHARRVTGDKGKAGVFAAYRFDRRVHAECKLGSAFHVGE